MFFFNDTATTEIYTLSLHDALPIWLVVVCNPNDPTGEHMPVAELDELLRALPERVVVLLDEALADYKSAEPRDAALSLLRSEEHTSELQSRQYLVCRLLLEKKTNIHLEGRRRLDHTKLKPQTGILCTTSVMGSDLLYDLPAGQVALPALTSQVYHTTTLFEA